MKTTSSTFNAKYHQAENKSSNKPKTPKRTPEMVGGLGAKDYSPDDKGDYGFDAGKSKWK